ncbi:hypothetical protein AB0M57_25355 [Streptomyces sp. NPDC051597]|uniref:hypothetical protein n=1 Tax=Streptomyces sp. NPDC051597 TaxID=3155049 RepID=UPI00344986EE
MAEMGGSSVGRWDRFRRWVGGAAQTGQMSRGQRFAASLAGTALGGAGATSVFVSENQAGGVALVVTGGLFLLMGVTGRFIKSIQAADWGITMEEQRELAERAKAQAEAGLTARAQATLDVLKRLSPTGGQNAEVRQAELALQTARFENRVLEAVDAARIDAEEVQRHPEAGLGEPIAILLTQPSIRIGIFAAYSENESGHIPQDSSDDFIRRAREFDCAAYLFVNGTLHEQDLNHLAEGIERDGGKYVSVTHWTSVERPRPLRPDIDRLLDRVRGPQNDTVTIPHQ